MQGKVRLGKRTKELATVLEPREIAVIAHEDLDAVGAAGLIEAGVLAVINACSSLTCRYPNLGPQMLWDHQVPLLDNVGERIFDLLTDGDLVEIQGRKVLRSGEIICVGSVVTDYVIKERHRLATLNLPRELDRFVTNTLDYALREKEVLLGNIAFPVMVADLRRKTVVVVVRGIGYREDLKVLGPFIQEARPIMLGVDGGADALIASGYRPHIIVGDMDSVSDSALRSGAQLIAHAYPDGRCPGEERLARLQVPYHVVAAPGTSEDLGLLLAHEEGADLIVLVGSHSNMIDFLEKGRPGMASTFLTRLKIGPILLDAKKVSELYRPSGSLNAVPVILAALIPILLFIALASPWRHYIRLLWLQLRLIAGWL
ncbi:MAG TPA: hypothetical protein DDW87_07055 [Firmicutes bacterium]|nr:hypothetical protein [Bacillota bacterium]